jgi:polyhydroxybutyrate depolymerase
MFTVLAAALVVLVAGIITVSVSGNSSTPSRVSAISSTPPSPSALSTADSPTVAATPTSSAAPTRIASPTHFPITTRTPSSVHPKVETSNAAVGVGTAAAACHVSSGTITVANRSVIVDLPSHFPAPVVFDYHGGNQSAVQEHAYTGLAAAGVRQGFIVVTPNGTGGLWNFPTTEALPDDVAYTQTVAAMLGFAGCSNGRLYTAGISDGADMAITAACRIPDVRAVFAVAPSIIPRGACTKKPYLEVHGTADPVVPYTGSANGSFADTPSQAVSVRLPFWTAGCSGPVGGRGLAAGTTVQDWTCGGGRVVELDTVSGGGHTWPGAIGPEPAAGLGSRAPWSATNVALAFFASR